MSMKSGTSLPRRLCAGEATELEQRLLRAASEERPSRELAERMARVIGVSSPALSTTVDERAPDLGSHAPEVAAAGGRTLLPWVTGTVAVAAVVAGSLVLGRSESGAPSTQRRVTPPPVSAQAAANAPANLSDTTGVAQAVDGSPRVASSEESVPRGPVASAQRRQQSTRVGDLEEQIALIDAARAAVAGGAPERALASLGQYQKRYAPGSFGPEATALRVEALVKLGRTAEARAHATRFIARHPGSPLAERVMRLAGLPRP